MGDRGRADWPSNRPKARHEEYVRRVGSGSIKKQHPIKSRQYNLKRYGITPEDYEVLRLKQQFRCALCGEHETRVDKKRLHVDHDHHDNSVRGLLCSKCNLALGLLRDDAGLLEAAANYVRRFSGASVDRWR